MLQFRFKHKTICLLFFCIFVSAAIMLNSINQLSFIANIAFVPYMFFAGLLILRKHSFISISEINTLGLFVLVGFVSFIISGNNLGIGMCYSILSMFILVTLAYCVIDYSDVNTIENWIIVATIILLLATVFLSGTVERLGEGVSNSINLAINLSICSLIFTHRLCNGKGSYNFIFLLITLVFILYTQTRAALLVSGSLFVVSFVFSNSKLKLYQKILIVLFLLTAIYIGIETEFMARYTHRFIGITDEIAGFRFDQMGYDSVTMRLYYKAVGIQAFIEKPFLGHGIGTSRQFLGGTYFHDNYVELLYETGIVGLGLYLITHMIVLLKSIKRKCMLATLFVSFILFYGFFDSTYHNKIFYIVLTMAIILVNKMEQYVDS